MITKVEISNYSGVLEALSQLNYEPEDGFRVTKKKITFDTTLNGVNPVALLVAIGHLEDIIQSPVDAVAYFSDGSVLSA
jgi:hypothetical protein